MNLPPPLDDPGGAHDEPGRQQKRLITNPGIGSQASSERQLIIQIG
jgi:hypothetical protein